MLPAIVPRLFVALRLGVAIALVVAVTVEIAANPHGMGYAMMIAQQSLDPALMLAWLFWIGVVGYAINAAALRLQQRVARAHGGAARMNAPRACRGAMRRARWPVLARRCWRCGGPASHGGWVSRVFLPTPEATLASLREGLAGGELAGLHRGHASRAWCRAGCWRRCWASRWAR